MKKGKGKLYELLMGSRAYGAAAANKKIKEELKNKKTPATAETENRAIAFYGTDISGMSDVAKNKKKKEEEERKKRKTVLTGNK